MVLTHFLALLAAPGPVARPAAALLPFSSTQPLITGSNLGLAPALPVRVATTVLLVRER